MDASPALDMTNPLEATDAVRTIRETYAAAAWSSLVNSEHFREFSIFINPNFRQFSSLIEIERNASHPVDIGPRPFTPVDIRESETGAQIVTICVSADGAEYHLNTETAMTPGIESSSLLVYEVYKMDDDELAPLSAYGVNEGALRMRRTNEAPAEVDCATVPIIQQVFTHWADYLAR